MSFIDLNEVNLYAISPILALIAFGILILIIGVFFKELDKKFFITLSLIGVIFSIFCIINITSPGTSFYNLYNIDGFAFVSQLLVGLGALLFLPLNFNNIKDNEANVPEFYALFLFMIAAFMLMVGSFNLIFIFIALETGSLVLYTLIAMNSHAKSIEAAIKYFSLGALSAGLFCFGSAMLYLGSGSLDLLTISEHIITFDIKENIIILLGAAFLIASIGFKLSLVPFHMWVKDVYEGASLNLSGFISVVPKVAACIVAIRIFRLLSESGIEYINAILIILAVVTMSVSNIAALAQKDIRSMLAYSSISHAGFVLTAILIGSKDSMMSMFYYWGMLLFVNIATFALIGLITPSNSRYTHEHNRLNGLFSVSPIFALVLGLFFITLAGIPPFSMFWAKMLLISSAISNGYLDLGIIMVINSAIALVYYLKPVVSMFMKINNLQVDILNISLPVKIIIFISVFITCFGFIYSDYILNALALSVEVFEF